MGAVGSLAPFPLHQMVNTMTATINNNSVSMNVQDVLPASLRMCDPEELAEYDAATPTTQDYLANYRDGADVMSYQILRTGAGTANARPAVFGVGPPADAAGGSSVGTATQKFISYPSNVLSYDLSSPAASAYRKPRGNYVIKRIYNAAGLIPAVGDALVYVGVEITEPLLISPFVFGAPENKAGFYGIANVCLQMSMAANATERGEA